MSSSQPSKRSENYPEGDDEPWWERDRRGGSAARDQHNVRNSHRDYRDDRARGYNTARHDDRRSPPHDQSGGRGYRAPPRGSYRGGGGYSDRRPRDDYPRGHPPSHQPAYGNVPGREEGEVMLNYSDAPSRQYRSPENHYRQLSPGRFQEPSGPHPSRPSTSASSAAPGAAPSVSVPTEVDSTPLSLDPVEEPDPEQVLAERRRKRAEILAKYAKDKPQEATVPSRSGADTAASTRENTLDLDGPEEERAAKRPKLESDPAAVASASTTTDPSRATSVESVNTPQLAQFTLLKDGEEKAAAQDDASLRNVVHKSDITGEDEPEVSAADYNPDFDRREDEKRMERLEGSRKTIEIEEESEEDEEEDGDDDEDDMFAIGTEQEKPKKKRSKKTKAVPVVNRIVDVSTNPSLLADNFDDAEGYYKVILGEVLDGGRYLVQANLGKGMFSSVVKAKDLGEEGKGVYQDADGDRREVAIKMVRSQESMFKAGLKEAQILRRLMDADPEDKRHMIRLLRTFEHRGHLCLVFESLSMNLREVVKRYGKDVGLNLRAVRTYASQMFLALALMKKCELMHADLKPDNILVNESKSTLKVCDLGSASDTSENDITPYLVSRFYRAPEIILGLPYDCSLDVWSIGCTLYELYTGKILFPGRTNNHMLLLMMETKGKIPNKLIKKARFGDQHFDENQNFLSHEKNDTITPRQIPSKPPSDLRSRLMPSGTTRNLKDDEVRLLSNFVDLLDKMLSLEPSKRPLPRDLLAHPFIRG
ncbi:PRP4 family serine/threonine-protein kinase [Sporobolomyces koalae]|uniref:PRP4 family serine/threonine-protein kinase n=1 Tax=Sporobolomyces koalae TaxID=500713 RepID=UPI0031708815